MDTGLKLRDQATIDNEIYFLPKDPVAAEILIPGFRSAISVRGAFGWFTAEWVSRLAPGLADYLLRDNVQPICFTVAPTFFPAELNAVKVGVEMDPGEAVMRIRNLFVNNRENISALSRHALDCLAWMIAARKLHLRVAVPEPHSNYHPKIWLFDDGQDLVIAHGSANATSHGLSSGNEHINVDVSWKAEGYKKILKTKAVMDDWWNGTAQGIIETVELPVALREDIIRTAPERCPNFQDYKIALKKDNQPAWATDSLKALQARFERNIPMPSPPKLKIPDWLEWMEGKYRHQGEAVTAWEKTEIPHRGTLEMATGAGKTLTSLVCATRLQDNLNGQSLLVVISAPSTPLIKQWCTEVRKFGVKATAPSLESDTNSSLTRLFRGLVNDGTQVLVCTNKLLCKEQFQQSLSRELSRRKTVSMFIGDEAHTLGAEAFLNNTPEFFQYRLALSATPIRQYDPDGTEHIFEFFGPTVFNFGLEKAIGLCLVPYDYYIHVATLNSEETARFRDLTVSIGTHIARGDGIDDDNQALTSLLIARRRVVETTKAKIALLKKVLQARGPSSLQHALIYASAKNPEQFNQIKQLLDDLDIRWAPVTEETTKNASLLSKTFDSFALGGYQVLLAKKVLDEGVDIPSIREAFIVASSTVEREWIQRRGRVLRTHLGKSFAVVHDFLGLPPTKIIQRNDKALMRLVGRELGRALSFAEHSRNALGENGIIAQVQHVRSAYWPDGTTNDDFDRSSSAIVSSSIPKGKLC